MFAGQVEKHAEGVPNAFAGIRHNRTANPEADTDHRKACDKS
jgi:hypothetical protein